MSETFVAAVASRTADTAVASRVDTIVASHPVETAVVAQDEQLELSALPSDVLAQLLDKFCVCSKLLLRLDGVGVV